MDECRKVSNDGRPVPERCEWDGGVVDVVLLEKEPGRETNDTDNERGENVCRRPAVLLSSPAEGDDKEAAKKKDPRSAHGRRRATLAA